MKRSDVFSSQWASESGGVHAMEEEGCACESVGEKDDLSRAMNALLRKV
jgi:hypothetical protein